MRVQAMVTQADPQTRAHPIQDHGDGEKLPTEHEERRDGPYVEKRHYNAGEPINAVALGYADDFGGHREISRMKRYTFNVTRISLIVCKSYVISMSEGGG